ncbi:MAG: TrbI/VirB10 family protein [Vicinamibacterales bacterium]
MFSKPLGILLCLTAAAGGAYVATRHNAAERAISVEVQAAPAATSPATPPNPAVAPPQPVAETEARVTGRVAEAPDAANVASGRGNGPAPTQGPDAPARKAAAVAEKVPTKARTEARRPAAARNASAPPQSASSSQGPASPGPNGSTPQRTVPMNGGAAVAPGQAESQAAIQPAVALPQPESSRAVEAQPEPARVPQFEEVILPASSVIGLQLESALSSERARLEDRVEARVSRDVMAAGRVAIPVGSRVIGSVIEVDRGGKLKTAARLGIRFHTLVLTDGTEVALRTESIFRDGESPSRDSAKKIGGGAIAGMILGGILGGGKGAAVGGATGAAGGTAAAMSGDRAAVTIAPGQFLNARLSSPTTITVQRREQ